MGHTKGSRPDMAHEPWWTREHAGSRAHTGQAAHSGKARRPASPTPRLHSTGQLPTQEGPTVETDLPISSLDYQPGSSFLNTNEAGLPWRSSG